MADVVVKCEERERDDEARGSSMQGMTNSMEGTALPDGDEATCLLNTQGCE